MLKHRCDPTRLLDKASLSLFTFPMLHLTPCCSTPLEGALRDGPGASKNSVKNANT